MMKLMRMTVTMMIVTACAHLASISIKKFQEQQANGRINLIG